MNQISDILSLVKQATDQGVDAVLATVVHTEGSAYRRAGAMMLICQDGQSSGMISGGCLEPHVIKKAFWLTRNGSVVQVFQTGEDPDKDNIQDLNHNVYQDNSLDDNDMGIDIDIDLNFGLGCNGRVHVLFERLKTALPFLNLIKEVRRTQQPQFVATLIRSSGLTLDAFVGLRALLNPDSHSILETLKPDTSENENSLNTVCVNQNIYQSLINALFESDLITDNLGSKSTQVVVIDNPDNKEGQSKWLIQKIKPQIRLLICGAGNDVIPLVTMAKMQDWHVSVIDSRIHYANRHRFMSADIVECLPLDAEKKLLSLSHHAAVAVMSHSLTQDRARLNVLLKHPPIYLGQLGPKYRTERLIDEIKNLCEEQGDNPSIVFDGVAQLHYPIGYKLGGDGPEALAIAIIAQINAVMHGQNNALFEDFSQRTTKRLHC